MTEFEIKKSFRTSTLYLAAFAVTLGADVHVEKDDRNKKEFNLICGHKDIHGNTLDPDEIKNMYFNHHKIDVTEYINNIIYIKNLMKEK